MRQWIALTLVACSVIAVAIGLFQSANTYRALNDPDKKARALFGNQPYLALISIDGMIHEEAASSGVLDQKPSSVQARKALYEAANDADVKGVLLRINSPGGTVGMSQELNAAVKAVKKKKPVVVSMGDVAASGGYYTAAPADKIVANPGTLTASIGVIIHTMNLETLMTQKLGVRPVTVKSGKYKDILSPYRQPTADDMAMIQKMIDDSYAQFIGAVLEGRLAGIDDPAKKAAMEKTIRSVADGRIVIGSEAVKVGLVDEVGGQEFAKQVLADLVKERYTRIKEDLPLKPYGGGASFLDLLAGDGASNGPLMPLLGWLGWLLPPAANQVAAPLPMSSGRIGLPGLGGVGDVPVNQPLWLME
ncbi:MAG: signal peptide peptidase SppA [Cyanobacteria bacterium HKST-UBA03]|nr:signal peptide peptidase SppA [Cyanobacteria bacterium HKST-UBA03]